VATKLYLLGQPHGERDGLSIGLSAKAAALLGYLALSNDPQPRERVLGLLWGESTEEAARKNLRNTLWAIRKDLGSEAIETAGDRLALDDGLQVDVRTLRAATPSSDPAGLLDLYAGPFLDGLVLSDAPDFELWLVTARERLAETFLSCMTDILSELGRAGSWRDVGEFSRRALVHDPLHEGLYRALMQALSRQGQRAEALRQYETLRAALERELAVEPSPETRALREAIATPDAGPQPAGKSPAETPRSRRQPTRAMQVQAEPPFVGRDRERAALDGELLLASQGQARVAVLSGELGIGKSRLWREWLSGLRIECTALQARCVEATSSLPFTPLVELFGSHPCTQQLFHPPSALPSAWLAEVSRLLPQVRTEAPELPPPAALPPEEERRRVFEAFVQVLLALDAHPLLIFVDDVHWADRATLDWLPYLVHRMRGQPLLLVLALRPEEAPPVLVHQLAAWSREGVLRRIPLARLNPEETAALIARLHVDVTAAHLLQAQSAGNPYFLLELSHNLDTAAGGAVPPALADLVAVRIDKLGNDSRSVLQAAGVLEPEFDLPLLVQTTGLDEDAVLDALDELLGARLLTERGDGFAFNHPFLSQVVRQGLNVARRKVMHRRAAQALETSHTDALAPLAGLIAGHYAEAGVLARAAYYLGLAAEHATSLAALAEAVAFRRRAWQIEPTPPRELALADALYRSGALAESRDAYAQALAAAEEIADGATATRACLGMGYTYLSTGWADEVKHWAEQSLRYLDAEGDPSAHASAHFLLGVGRLRSGDSALEEAEGELAEAVKLAGLHDVRDVSIVARFELGNARAERGDLAGAIKMYRQTADLARAAGEPNQQVLALNNLAYHTMLLGDTTAAREYIREAFGLADQYGLRMSHEYLLSTRGEIELADGNWAGAEEWVNASLAEARAHNNVAQVAKCRANLGLAARGRGDLDTALILLEEAAGLAAPLTARYLQGQIDLRLTEVYLARGEQAAADQVLSRGEARLADSHYQGLIDRSRELRARL
jgi:DNA-binding SARP family transcriptional activator/tetratricopeptide (TPR) repeat protein